MKPCIEENWFVEDSLEDERLCNHPLLQYFGNTKEEAFREMYQMSRAMRVRRIMAGQFDWARATGHTASLEVMETIAGMIGIGMHNLMEHKPHLFENKQTV